ncbi:MAG TPA: hypothetical protein VGJ49_00375, partial [Gaiellaceae bacterium]
MRRAAMIALLAVLAAGCGSSHERSASSLAPVHGPYAPSIDPKNFVTVIDNRYWPLKPGTGFHFKGFKGAAEQTDDEVVTGKTKRILGIDAVAVRDTVSQHGQPIERTLDYYA